MIFLESPARKQLRRLKESLAAVSATGDATAVHNVRVACRRLNELLDLMAERLDKRKVRSPRKSLKRIRRAFQRVRDLDVLLESLCKPQTLQHLPTHELARLEGELTCQREAAMRRSWRKCRQARPDRALRQVASLCEILERAAVDERPALQARLEQMLHERAAAVLSHDPRRTETSDLHEDRIRLKRLRYVAELIDRFELGLSREPIRVLVRVQGLLGRWHDHLVAADRIIRLARRPSAMHEQSTGSARLLEYAAHRLWAAEQDRQQILADWTDLERAIHEAQMPLGPCPAPLREAADSAHAADA